MAKINQPTTMLEAFEEYRTFAFHDFALKSISGRGQEREYSRDEIVSLIHGTARLLVNQDLKKGDRILLGPADPAAFFIGFWACQLIGAIAVPFKKPENNETGEVLSHIIENCGPSLILLDSPASHLAVRCETLLIDFDRLSTADASELPRPSVSSQDVAVIQYTSGSTSNPKGCVLTHQAMLTNCNGIFDRSEGHAGETCVHWVPLHHDMGLMGGVLAPVILKARNVLIETRRFMTQPLSWIKALAQHGYCHSSVSNFALSMVLKRVRRLDLEAHSLEEVKNIFCGAEPIDARLVSDFNDALAQFGLRPDAVHPAYGLAEVTLMATSRKGGLRSRSFDTDSNMIGSTIGRSKERYVSVGTPLSGSKVRIVDEDRNELSDGHVGEIAISTPSVMRGYWNNDRATQERMRDGWLFTGDLGSIIDGELFITGRKSDLMIIAGRNIYPHDVERTLAKVIDFDPHRVCAFSIAEVATERLVVVIEARGSQPNLEQTIEARKTIEARFGTSPEVVVCKGNAIPRTSSGKPRRKALASSHKRGELKLLEREQGPNRDMSTVLADQPKDVLMN